MDDKKAKQVQANQNKQTKAKSQKAEKKAKETAPKETREQLNDRARFDYGIMNAADMSDKQLKEEMSALDKQVEDGKKENEQAEKDNADRTISDSNGGVPAQPAR